MRASLSICSSVGPDGAVDGRLEGTDSDCERWWPRPACPASECNRRSFGGDFSVKDEKVEDNLCPFDAGKSGVFGLSLECSTSVSCDLTPAMCSINSYLLVGLIERAKDVSVSVTLPASSRSAFALGLLSCNFLGESRGAATFGLTGSATDAVGLPVVVLPAIAVPFFATLAGLAAAPVVEALGAALFLASADPPVEDGGPILVDVPEIGTPVAPALLVRPPTPAASRLLMRLLEPFAPKRPGRLVDASSLSKGRAGDLAGAAGRPCEGAGRVAEGARRGASGGGRPRRGVRLSSGREDMV